MNAAKTDEMAQRLADFVAREEALEPERVRATGLLRLAGGAAREIWSVDLAIEREHGVESLPLVVRKDPAGRVGDGGDRSVERSVLRAAWAGGVPVPRPRWGTADASVLGAIAARIQALDLSQPDLTALPRPPADRSPARAEVERVAASIG